MTTEAMLLTRAWPVASAGPDFDGWQARKHIPELVAGGHLTEARYYVAVEEGIPPRFVGTGLKMAVYFGADVSALLGWMESPTLTDALADGVRWFDSFHRLDGEPFTGNVYERCGADAAGAADGTGGGPVLALRWEQPGRSEDTREQIAEELLAAIGGLAGVTSASRWRVTARPIPVPYYRSPGADVIWAEFASTSALESTLGALRSDAAGKVLDRVVDESRYATHEAFAFSFRVQAPSTTKAVGD